MEMEVMIPSHTPAPDFNFDSSSTTPYLSTTSSPQRFTNIFFYSAPTSPTRISTFYHAGDLHHSTPSAVPFHWEEKPGTRKSTSTDTDFAFDFSAHLHSPSLPADELFHAGKIRPLKPPPRLHSLDVVDSPSKSPRRILSPRRHRPPTDDVDPFAAALEQTSKESSIGSSSNRSGRERNTNPQPPPPSSSSSRERNKGSWRSLSPFRVSDLPFDQEEDQSKNSSSSSSSSWLWYKKWKIKDLLLFRSASESRAKDKEQQMKKYWQLKKSRNDKDDVKQSSFRSTEL